MKDAVIIREEDLIETVADALQYISYYHPMDYITALGEAYKVEPVSYTHLTLPTICSV